MGRTEPDCRFSLFTVVMRSCFYFHVALLPTLAQPCSECCIACAFRHGFTGAARACAAILAADDRQLTKTIARYGRVDLLCIDELGYMELDKRGAELLFQVLTEREEKSAIAIASNEAFSGWTKTFTDPRLCAAIVDRLTFAGQIIETGTTSYRLAHTRRTSGATTSRPAGAKSS